MKKIGACLLLVVNLPVLFAQTNMPAARSLSLTDCFAAALKHNFDVQIEQFAPQISLYNLNSAYGGYDPQLNLSGQHRYDDAGAAIQNNQFVAPTTSDENAFTAGLNGLTPWGLTYNFNGNVNEQYGSKSLGAYTTPFDASGGSFGVSLTQPLLKNFWIDNNRLTILVAKNQLKYYEQALRGQIITSMTAVENAYYELIYARENVKVQQEALSLSETQLDQDKQRVQIGSVAERDGTLEQDESQVAQSRANLISAISTLGTDQRVLKNLITDEYSEWVDADIQPTTTLEAQPQLFDLQDSWSKGMTQRPELLQARLNVEQQGIQLKYLRNQLFPELDLVGSYGFNGAGREFNNALGQMNEGSRPYYVYGGQMSIPLSNARARNQLKAGKVSLKQLLLQVKQLEQKIMVEIDNAVGVAKSDYESVDASRQARIYAEAALDAEQKKYAVGKSTTFTVLQLQNNLTSVRSQEMRALANYNQALANLALQEGSTLERHKIDVQAK